MMMLNIRANQNAQTHVSNLRCDVRKLDQTIGAWAGLARGNGNDVAQARRADDSPAE